MVLWGLCPRIASVWLQLFIIVCGSSITGYHMSSMIVDNKATLDNQLRVYRLQEMYLVFIYTY